MSPSRVDQIVEYLKQKKAAQVNVSIVFREKDWPRVAMKRAGLGREVGGGEGEEGGPEHQIWWCISSSESFVLSD